VQSDGKLVVVGETSAGTATMRSTYALQHDGTLIGVCRGPANDTRAIDQDSYPIGSARTRCERVSSSPRARNPIRCIAARSSRCVRDGSLDPQFGNARVARFQRSTASVPLASGRSCRPTQILQSPGRPADVEDLRGPLNQNGTIDSGFGACRGRNRGCRRLALHVWSDIDAKADLRIGGTLRDDVRAFVAKFTPGRKSQTRRFNAAACGTR